MRTHLPRLACVAVMAIALRACASAERPRPGRSGRGRQPRTVEPAAVVAAPAAAADAAGIDGADGRGGARDRVLRHGFHSPAMVMVPAAGTYTVDFKNTGIRPLHDITFSEGTVIHG